MPELPEVETIRKGLDRLIVGKEIVKVTSRSFKQLKPSLKMVRQVVLGTKVKKVGRRAKVLQLFLDNGQILIVHLKMTGQLIYRPKTNKQELRGEYTRAIIEFKDGSRLFFNDLRKFGWIKLVSDKKELKNVLAKFGPEPLTDLDLKTFREIMASTKRSVKIVLMDQKKIAGVGNIYANDALFLAGIDPRRPANKLTERETEKLFCSLERVLRAGLQHRGASDQHYLDALGQKGSYQDHFLVYDREGKACFQCSGLVRKIKIGGRGTYFCPHCQR